MVGTAHPFGSSPAASRAARVKVDLSQIAHGFAQQRLKPFAGLARRLFVAHPKGANIV